MNFKENESPEKLRGGYYTPDSIASFLARWVLLNKPKSILEPSCGDGSFIKALNKTTSYTTRFTGIELLKEEAAKALNQANLNKKLDANIINSDFLEWGLEKLNKGITFDAVLGNPPRHRNRSTAHFASRSRLGLSSFTQRHRTSH